MKQMNLSLAVAAAMATGSAFAAPIASTSKKGSLLIFPMINIETGADTAIEISNDYTGAVHVKCAYVNEQRGRAHFDFDLTSKQTLAWNVGAMTGDGISPPAFPPDGRRAALGSNRRGELICFAVAPDLSTQVSWNHLHGAATVTRDEKSFRYNPWAFQALDDFGAPSAALNSPVGAPGKLLLEGVANTYDACPKYNITTFMPNGASLPPRASIANDFSFSVCNQDLRQDFGVSRTKLEFERVWNAKQQGYGGAYSCVEPVGSLTLNANPKLVAGSNFEYATLRTKSARFQAQGVSAEVCPRSKTVGLLGVHWASIRTGASTAYVGSTMHAAGAVNGFVFWDPASDTVPLRPE